MDLRLFLRRQQIDSTFVFSLMNHNRLNFSLFVENSLSGLKIAQLENSEISSLPALIVNYKSNSKLIKEREEIIKYLISQKLLKRGINYSAWEQQTCEYLYKNTYPLALGLTAGFSRRFSQCMKILPKHSTSETFGYVYKSFKDTLSLAYEDKFINKLIKTSDIEFLNELKEWEIRLNSQDFHGGTAPDKADFLMYSCIEANWLFTKPLVYKIPGLLAWKCKMDSLSDQEH